MPPTSSRVLLDANVLYPLCLRDVLLWSAAAGHFRLLWSDKILNETTRNLVKHRRITPEQGQELSKMLKDAFPDALVTSYEDVIDAMPNAEHDRHVVAAAVRSGAQIIVTQNLHERPPKTIPQLLDALQGTVPRFAADARRWLKEKAPLSSQ